MLKAYITVSDRDSFMRQAQEDDEQERERVMELDKRLERLDKLREGKEIKVRVYVIQGHNLLPKGFGRKASPYVVLSMKGRTDLVGAEGRIHHLDDAVNMLSDTLSPEFYKPFELDATIPDVSTLQIEIRDGSSLLGTEVGRTLIDLEDRWIHPNWEAHARSRDIPKEFRTLWNPSTPGVPQGKLELWLEMYEAEAAADIPFVPIEAPKPEEWELRLVVWQARKVPLVDGGKVRPVRPPHLRWSPLTAAADPAECRHLCQLRDDHRGGRERGEPLPFLRQVRHGRAQRVEGRIGHVQLPDAVPGHDSLPPAAPQSPGVGPRPLLCRHFHRRGQRQHVELLHPGAGRRERVWLGRGVGLAQRGAGSRFQWLTIASPAQALDNGERADRGRTWIKMTHPKHPTEPRVRASRAQPRTRPAVTDHARAFGAGRGGTPDDPGDAQARRQATRWCCARGAERGPLPAGRGAAAALRFRWWRRSWQALLLPLCLHRHRRSGGVAGYGLGGRREVFGLSQHPILLA